MSGASDLRTKTPLLGLWCATGHPAIVDAAASVGPDWICIDTQHGVDLGRLDSSLFTVMANYGVASVVRVPSNEASAIGRALDLGADGIVVPLVDTADDATAAVSATRHAPAGTRSYGMQTNRLGPFDQRPFVVIQVETADAVANLQRIASVDGVDALYIGPADLGLALAGQPATVSAVFEGEHPEVREACDAVVSAASEAGVLSGLHCVTGAEAKLAIGAGFGMMAVTSDVGAMASQLGAELDSVRS